MSRICLENEESVVLLKFALLGILQGITEFLPISSSGHLVIVQELLGLKSPGISFEIFVHTATLFVILYVFRNRIISIGASIFNSHRDARSDDLRILHFILVATVPSVVVGFFFRHQVEKMFTNLNVVGVALLLTGSCVFLTRLARPKRRGLRFWDAVIIGISQAAALVPGISRSGITISTALFLGYGRKESAEFCFLLAVPTILGATILEMRNVMAITDGTNLLSFILGFLAAVFSGFFAIKIVLQTLRKRRFRHFAYYCWALGAIAIFVLRQ